MSMQHSQVEHQTVTAQRSPGTSRSPWRSRCRTDGRSIVSSLIHVCCVPGPWNSALPHQEQSNTKRATKTSCGACLKVGEVRIEIWWGYSRPSTLLFASGSNGYGCGWGGGTHTWKEMRIPRFLDLHPSTPHVENEALCCVVLSLKIILPYHHLSADQDSWSSCASSISFFFGIPTPCSWCHGRFNRLRTSQGFSRVGLKQVRHCFHPLCC